MQLFPPPRIKGAISDHSSAMAFRWIIQRYIHLDFGWSISHSRCYSVKIDWNKLRPMILKRIRNRAKDYPIPNMIPVAEDVLNARRVLTQGVSSILRVIPAKACKFCPEVYIGETGHQIRSCHGYKRIIKDQTHRWTEARLNDILVPVESFRLQYMHQSIIKHEQRFDFDRIPAVLELCSQAGAEIADGDLYSPNTISDIDSGGQGEAELSTIAQRTMDAWETLRLGVQRLLLVYPVKVCEHCSEVHVGPSGHKARLCGVFKYEIWRGAHMWKKAAVDDLVPPKVVWHRRPHDPPVLLDNGRGFYGHAPAVVELCIQAGARVPAKYFCMMKQHGLAPTFRASEANEEAGDGINI